MRWNMTKAIWERCRFTDTNLASAGGTAKGNATSLFLNAGTTVPENVMRHVYAIIAVNQNATYNTLDLYHVPDGATGTQWLFKDLHFTKARDEGQSQRGIVNLMYPEDPNPLAPFMALEGGSKLYASSATASMFITVKYWDDILTGIEDT